jgi:hypothetical protein
VLETKITKSFSLTMNCLSYLSPNDGIYQMSVTMILVLNDVVVNFQQERQVTMGVFAGVQEFRGREEFEQVH